jgi:hypothetical protein
MTDLETRRTRGWRRQVKIKQLFDALNDDESNIIEVTRSIDVREANYIMSELYDWADEHRIWIGGDIPSSLPSNRVSND